MPSLRAVASPGAWRRPLVAVLLLLLVAAVAAIPIGRWEGQRATAKQLRGIERVQAAVGPDILGTKLSGVAQVGALECLLYRADDYVYGLELCVDSAGRLVRAVDATGSADAHSWDVSADPSTASVLLQPGHLRDPSAVLDRRQALGETITLPKVQGAACFDSVGALLAGRKPRVVRTEIVEVCTSAVDLFGQAAGVARTLRADPVAELLAAAVGPVRAELALARDVVGLTRAQLLARASGLSRRHLQAKDAYVVSTSGLMAQRRALGIVG